MKCRPNGKGILVCFVGIDGAGKTTLANSMIAGYHEPGVEFRYLWGGFTSSFTIFKPFIAIAKKIVLRGNRYMEDSTTKGRVVKSKLLSTVYQYLMLVDYILQAFFRIRIPLAFGRNVICDRYIYDLVVSIGVLLDYRPDRTLALLHRCLALLPKPDLVFLLDLPENLAYQRKDDIVSLGFLRARRALYLEVVRHHDMTVLDASSSENSLLQSVSARVHCVIESEA